MRFKKYLEEKKVRKVGKNCVIFINFYVKNLFCLVGKAKSLIKLPHDANSRAITITKNKYRKSNDERIKKI